jgi:copper chaperone CopZ
MIVKYNIKGIHCHGCVNLITLTLEDHGFSNIIIDTASGNGTAEIKNEDFSAVQKKLEEAFKELPDYKLADVVQKV